VGERGGWKVREKDRIAEMDGWGLIASLVEGGLQRQSAEGAIIGEGSTADVMM